MANLSKASNVVQEKYILYDVTSFTQKWHSIPVATYCRLQLGTFSGTLVQVCSRRGSLRGFLGHERRGALIGYKNQGFLVKRRVPLVPW